MNGYLLASIIVAAVSFGWCVGFVMGIHMMVLYGVEDRGK